VIHLKKKSSDSTQQCLFDHADSKPTASKFIAAYRVMLVRDQDLPFEAGALSNSRQAQTIIRKLIETCGQSDREQFCVVLLNNKNEIIGLNIVSIGAVSFAHVHPREVLKPAILVSATAMILAHNHPSEDVSPSREDESITARIIKAAHIIGIKVHEHLIISMWGERYFSFADAGIIKRIYDEIG
jgi:DNA repair protein RadC